MTLQAYLSENSPSRDVETSGLAARVALLGSIAVALLVTLLHFIKPEFDPSWRFVSEYSIGANGWLMVLAFQCWALTCASLFVALGNRVTTRAGKIGRYLLLIVAVALVMAGLFAQDPVTSRPEEATGHGMLHALASLIGIPGIPIAAMLISLSLARHNPAFRARRSPLLWTANLTWISLILMALYLGWAVPRAGGFNPQVWAGWMNRLVVATYLAWQIVIARQLLSMAKRVDGS